MRDALRTSLGLLLLTSVACGGGDEADPAVDGGPADPDGSAAAPDAAGEVEDIDMQAADFECVLRWDRVRAFRLTNVLGHLDEALAVADNAAGGTYPVGTVIQLVPQEAMVKRRAGWNPPAGDWEFFRLSVSAGGTTIADRGDATENAFGSPCLPCHAQAQPQFDFVCESNHGCDPLPISTEQLVMLQDNDPRCP